MLVINTFNINNINGVSKSCVAFDHGLLQNKAAAIFSSMHYIPSSVLHFFGFCVLILPLIDTGNKTLCGGRRRNENKLTFNEQQHRSEALQQYYWRLRVLENRSQAQPWISFYFGLEADMSDSRGGLSIL